MLDLISQLDRRMGNLQHQESDGLMYPGRCWPNSFFKDKCAPGPTFVRSLYGAWWGSIPRLWTKHAHVLSHWAMPLSAAGPILWVLSVL
jgi:hypothetical protein